jgi:anti-anti-sigma factor
MIQIQTCPDDTIICRLSGDLDWQAATCLHHVIHDLLRPELDVVLDLREVVFIDAAGISVLIGCLRGVRFAGGTARIRRVNPRLQWIFELVGVARLTEKSSLNHPESGLIVSSEQGDSAASTRYRPI